MKVKIKEVIKTKDDYTPESKKYTLHNRQCKVDIDGVEEFAEVVTFSTEKYPSKTTVVADAVFDETTNDIKIEEKEYNGKKFKQITLKSVKKDSI